VVAAPLAVAVGCGGGSDDAQPRPDVTTFEDGEFDDVPLVPESDPVTPANQEAEVDARSYVVRNRTPAEVLQFYEQQLVDFPMVGEIEDIGNGTFRGRWQFRGGRILTVSATPGETLKGGDNPAAGQFLTQYSLVLAPAGG
jgi:hypothetical protein